MKDKLDSRPITTSTMMLANEDAAPMDRSPLDHELALLSLRTAQEVDRRLYGGKFNPTVLLEFGKRLSEASGVHGAAETALLYSDPKATEIFSRAVEEASAHSIADLETLTNSLRDIVDPLVRETSELSREELNMVKSFCLAFHKSLVAQRLPKLSERETPFNETTGLN